MNLNLVLSLSLNDDVKTNNIILGILIVMWFKKKKEKNEKVKKLAVKRVSERDSIS